MGQNLDDANLYYKQEWAREMSPFFGPNGTNFDALIHPQTAAETNNALELREKYKIDPVFAQKVNAEWGPLDWRVPEAHAIYWASLGLEKAKENPGDVKTNDLPQLRRVIYQSMQQAFRHGRYIADPFGGGYPLGPDLDIIPKVNESYEKEYAEEPDAGQRDGIQRARRNFLADAVYFLYDHNRVAEAATWYRYLGKEFPDKSLLENDANSYPRNLTLDEYAVGRVQEDIGDTSQERTTADIQGLLARAYIALAVGQDDRYAGYKLLARNIYESLHGPDFRYEKHREAHQPAAVGGTQSHRAQPTARPATRAPLCHARRDTLATWNSGGNECAARRCHFNQRACSGCACADQCARQLPGRQIIFGASFGRASVPRANA